MGMAKSSSVSSGRGSPWRRPDIMRQHLAQGFPFQQLHGNERLAILLAHVVDRADVRMV